jgi:hypothetical protein
MRLISTAIIRDHCWIELFFDRTLNLCAPVDDRIRYQRHLTLLLARHINSEDIIVCPALRKYLNEGKAIVARNCHNYGNVTPLSFCFPHWDQSPYLWKLIFYYR